MEILNQLKTELDQYYKEVLTNLKIAGKLDQYNQLKEHKYSVFYSNPLNTLKKGDIYYLGLNPRGQLDKPQDVTFENVTYDYCSYLPEDESWNGGSVHQKRNADLIKFSLSCLGRPSDDKHVRQVFCTNMYFFSSTNLNSLFAYGFEPEFFFNWHKHFLEIVRPKVVICNGNGEGLGSSYGSMKEMIQPSKIKEKIIQYYSGFSLKSFEGTFGKQLLQVIGIPHMSRHKLDNNTVKGHLLNDMKNIIES